MVCLNLRDILKTYSLLNRLKKAKILLFIVTLFCYYCYNFYHNIPFHYPNYFIYCFHTYSGLQRTRGQYGGERGQHLPHPHHFLEQFFFFHRKLENKIFTCECQLRLYLLNKAQLIDKKQIAFSEFVISAVNYPIPVNGAIVVTNNDFVCIFLFLT